MVPLHVVALVSTAFIAPVPSPLLAERRAPCQKLGQHTFGRIAMCDIPAPPPPSPKALPAREIDSRGFVVPQVGDVVKMPSKWPGEWDVGQVDFVQFIGARGAFEAVSYTHLTLPTKA